MSIHLVILRPSVPFDLWGEDVSNKGRCSHHCVGEPSQRDIGDVLISLSTTLALAQAKLGRTDTRMRMYTSASVLRHRRSLFSLVGRAPAQQA